jgi:hypothetical protein
MEKTRRFLERVMPQSAFGLTLLTMVVIVLVAGFFVHGLHLVSVDGEPVEGSSPLADRNIIPWTNPDPSIRLGPGESYRTGPASENDVAGAAPTFKGGSATGVASKNTASAAELASSAPVKPAKRYANSSAATPTVAPGYVAALTRTSECRWAANTEILKEGAQFKVGQTLNIAAGLVEIAFACGAKAILEGPAILELESNKSSALRVGKLTADVPDEVEGFTVHTPVVQVVSLCALQPKGVAKLTAASDCLWAEGTAATKEGDCLLPGQAVRLNDGLAEITFSSGAKVILQGPANLEIESAKTAILHGGRMTADVPDNLEGFKIRTAVVEILSLPGEVKETQDKPAAETPSPAKP